MGCCVVTDPLDVRSVAEVSGWVTYDSKKQRAMATTILRELRNEDDDNKIQQVLVAAASFMKHEGFATEMEFRLLSFPDKHNVDFKESGDRLIPFIDVLAGKSLTVQKVIIGPGWQLANLPASELAKHHVAQGIRRLLTLRGLSATDIESSRIPYDPR